ncbi:MAG: acetate kinase [Clostridiales bacterium]|nr:MAG: acetate kinase [Clostridiales bacterium]
MKILVINAGSSSLKYQLIEADSGTVLAKGNCERIGIDGRFTHKAGGRELVLESPMPTHAAAIKLVLQYLADQEWGVIRDVSEISAVGHRVVNGGEVFVEATLMDEEKIKTLEGLKEFAPLHNPAAVTGIRACVEVMGKDVPQVTVYDTAFHYAMPKTSAIYPIPYEYYEKYGIRRFGAHGTSHGYVAAECAKLLGKNPEELNIITCHLGNGSSITAVKGGRCLDTSMGFTPLAGVMMGTRCGDIDPAVAMYLMKKENLSLDEMSDIMNKKSGVFGVSGVSSDFRDLEAAADQGNERCRLALQMFAYQVVKYVGAYTAAMGGVDAIVFTAGIGENNPLIRRDVASALSFMGVRLDEEKNKVRGQTQVISTPDSSVTLCVIPTNEELAIARQTLEVISR